MAEDIIVLRSQEGINLVLQGTSRKILELLKAKRLDDPNNTLICITLTPNPGCQPLLHGCGQLSPVKTTGTLHNRPGKPEDHQLDHLH